MDPFATNYSELAIYDDGSCEYFEGEPSQEMPSEIWSSLFPDQDESNGYINGYEATDQGYPSECVGDDEGNVVCAYTFYKNYFNNINE
jgi:hypothetical protein